MPYELPQFSLATPPEATLEKVEWMQKLRSFTEEEARQRLGLSRACSALSDPLRSEASILQYRMTEPRSYQCASGHFVLSQEAFSETHCAKCGDAVFMTCDCGASALLTYTYKPPYLRANPYGHTASRETCFNCGAIYPWTYRYLSRATDDDYNDYERLILTELHKFPLDSKFEAMRQELYRETGPFAATFIHRVLRSGVYAIDPRHPAHCQLLDINERHQAARDNFASKVDALEHQIRTARKSTLAVALKAAETHSYWRSLSGTGFEKELHRLLSQQGLEVSHVGGRGDEGADLIVRKGKSIIVVQCKAYRKAVGPGAVRDLLGALSHRGATEAWLVSLEGFSDAAIRFAAGKKIKLIPIPAFLGKQGKVFVGELLKSL